MNAASCLFYKNDRCTSHDNHQAIGTEHDVLPPSHTTAAGSSPAQPAANLLPAEGSWRHGSLLGSAKYLATDITALPAAANAR
jgi:hypothetical protein